MRPPTSAQWPAERDYVAVVPKGKRPDEVSWDQGGVASGYEDILPFIDEWNKLQEKVSLLQGANRGDLALSWFGGKADARWITCSATAGSPFISTSADTFTSADVGKSVSVDGAVQAPLDLVAPVTYLAPDLVQVNTAALDNAHRKTGTIDGRALTELNISGGSTYVQAGLNVFVPGDNTKTLTMKEGLRVGRPLDAKITEVVNARMARLDRNAVAAVTNTRAVVGTNNAPMLQSAITEAIKTGRRLLLPYGELLIDFNFMAQTGFSGDPPKPMKSIKLTPDAATGRRDLWMAGAGMDQTRLLVLPRDQKYVPGAALDAGGYDTRVFYAQTAGAQIHFQDFTLVGPTTITYNDRKFDTQAQLGTAIHFAFFHQPSLNPDGTLSADMGGERNRVTWLRVKTEGFFFCSFSTYDANGYFELRDCDLRGSWGDGCEFFSNLFATQRKLRIIGGIIGGGSLNYTGDYGGIGNVIYGANNLGYIIQGVEFADNWRSVLRFTSTGGDKGPPPMGILQGCFFRARGSAIQTSGRSETPTLILGCHFDKDAPLKLQSKSSVIGCTIKGSVGVVSEDIEGPEYEVEFVGCKFYRSRTGHLILPHARTSVYVDNCKVYFEEGCDTGTSFVTGGVGKRLKIRDSEFYVRPLVTSGPIITVAPTTGTLTDILGCEFSGSAQAAINIGGAGTGKVRVHRNRFAMTNPIAMILQSLADGVVEARDNEWNSGTLLVSSAGRQFLKPGCSVNPSTVASAATLSLSRDYDTHYVSGTAAIANIHLWEDAPGVFSDARLTLIADEGWSLASSGNIAPKTTAARAAGEVVTLLFDGRSGQMKWREV